MELDQNKLYGSLIKALEVSIAWQGFRKHPKAANAYRSAYFCFQVGNLLDNLINDYFAPAVVKRRQISFNDNDEKIPGEWLLDIVWAEEYKPNKTDECTVPKNICCAIECESNTNIGEFFIDFSKLVNVISPIKIFLAGLNQTTPEKSEAYQKLRLNEAANYIQQLNTVSKDTDWYIGFWPSPKSNNGVSLWDSFKKYKHLKSIHLYKYANNSFMKI